MTLSNRDETGFRMLTGREALERGFLATHDSATTGSTMDTHSETAASPEAARAETWTASPTPTPSPTARAS